MGRLLASSGSDNAVRLWDATTGEALQSLQDTDHVITLFFGRGVESGWLTARQCKLSAWSTYVGDEYR